MKTTLNYEFEGYLFQSLQLAIEIHGEIGIMPKSIECDNKTLNFNMPDAMLVLCGDCTPDDYADKHAIL